MKRLLMDDLVQWKNGKHRKPLILQGARQVGKTWLMQEFGRLYFKNVAYINFDNNERMQNVFSENLDIPRLISALRVESKVPIEPEETLLIFDEIQEVPGALTSLKYFCENAPEYVIVAAGSLLGIALHQGTSFPVGKVDFLSLYPMTFQEFLWAVGEDDLVDLLDKADYEMMDVFSSKYTELLRRYYYVGGMPEVVASYVETDDLYEVRRLQKELLTHYTNDFSKHASPDIVPRIHMVWDAVPMQLAKENKKFIYGAVREGARAKDFEVAIQWLTDCSLLHKGYRVSKPGLPLIAYMEMSAFKLYFLDVGLLSALCRLDAKTLLEGNKVFTEFKALLLCHPEFHGGD